VPNIDWLNRLIKFKMIFVGWQLGTRAKGDPESDAVRDHREVSMLLRVEVSALVRLLIEKGVFTGSEYELQVQIEARALTETYEKRWPGAKATDDGIELDPALAAPWMSKFPP
jgi:hypothetical protein